MLNELAERILNEKRRVEDCWPGECSFDLELAEEAAEAIQQLWGPYPWQPIATAPCDGSRVLLLIPPYGAGSGHWDGRWIGHFVLNREAEPTHWAPLPRPPEGTNG